MKKRIVVIAMLIATAFFWLPSDRNSVSAQEKGKGNGKNRGGGMSRIWQQPTTHKPNQSRGHKDAHGYRNYGQYRRTQVGHRRFRMQRRYIWQNGTRLSRYTRVYY